MHQKFFTKKTAIHMDCRFFHCTRLSCFSPVGSSPYAKCISCDKKRGQNALLIMSDSIQTNLIQIKTISLYRRQLCYSFYCLYSFLFCSYKSSRCLLSFLFYHLGDCETMIPNAFHQNFYLKNVLIYRLF